MTTHLRARAVQAGALLALVGGMLAVAASPAQAAPPGVVIDNVSSTNIASGERTTIKFTITNNNPDVPNVSRSVTINVTGLDCRGDCSPVERIDPGESENFTANLTGGQVKAGDTKNVRVQITARLNNETGNANQDITVRGPDKPQQVRQISGRVKDSDGKAVSGAQVLMQDSSGHKYNTTSDGDGGYQFTSSDSKPITPGTISVGAAKDGFDPVAVSVQGGAGKTVNVPLTFASKVAVSPSATPSATDTASAAPLDEATDPATAATDGAVPETNSAANADSGSGSLLFIILGGLLVAAGVGAIVLVLMRRKGNDDDPESLDDPDGGLPPGAGGRYPDATRVAAPVGARAADATMITPMSGAPPMSDAPTMLQRPVPAEDEFPDPYGAPSMPPTYGGGSATQYGSPTQYGNAYGGPPAVPTQGGGYDDGYGASPTGAYGRRPPAPTDAGYGVESQQRYDEPTGMYRPQDQGYDQGGYRQETEYPQAGRGRPEATGAGYPAGGDGYGGQQQPDQGGYGSWGAPVGGIDSGNAYGPAGGADYGRGGGYDGEQGGGNYGAPAGGGGYGAPAYGAPAGGNYGAPAGGNYGDEGGYDPRATYGRPDARGQSPDPGHGSRGGQPSYGGDQGGYPPQGAGGYDGEEQQGGRHGGGGQQPPPSQSTHPGQRRPLDWLDD